MAEPTAEEILDSIQIFMEDKSAPIPTSTQEDQLSWIDLLHDEPPAPPTITEPLLLPYTITRQLPRVGTRVQRGDIE